MVVRQGAFVGVAVAMNWRFVASTPFCSHCYSFARHSDLYDYQIDSFLLILLPFLLILYESFCKRLSTKNV
jgi:hypothetical protein